MERKNNLPRNSITILGDLIRAKRPLPVKKIAERNSMSWKTANDHIKRLESRNLVKCTNGKRRNYCKVNPSLLKSIGRP